MPSKEILKSNCIILLADDKNPRCRKSNDDVKEATRHMDHMGIAKPGRAVCRADGGDPMLTLSKADAGKPKRVTPKADEAKPKRPSCRKNTVESTRQ